MKTKIKFWIQATMIALSSLLLVTNCTKDDDDTIGTNIPVVKTNEITEITETTATSGGDITSDGGASIIVRGVCWSTSDTPTVTDNKTQDGSVVGGFTSSITDLTAETTYFIRAYATNRNGTGYGSIKSFTTLEENNLFNPDITYGSMTDIDGNIYKTVTIGTQTWMAENLKTTKYNDDTPIPNVTDDDTWKNLTTGAYCNYDNLESNAEIYGRLYNWYAVNTGKLAPAGWHVPTDDDWTILKNYLIANGYSYGGIKDENNIAKSLCAKTNWALSSTPGTPGTVPENNNSSGFTALPGGTRYYGNGHFSSIGKYGGWWSSTESSGSNAGFRSLSYDYKDLGISNHNKVNGFSVRLVRD